MTYVIAEIGSNHDGDFAQAQRLIREAWSAGANAVKFQCLPSLPMEWMPLLKVCADSFFLECFATPFDISAVNYLANLGVPYIKIASAEILNLDLIRAAAATEIPLLISTGMASLAEIDEALIAAHGFATGATLLQCTSEYPARADHVNLRVLQTLRDKFGLPVGLSDHSESTAIPAAAVALGATVIEKHITLDHTAAGPDHKFALEPREFGLMVDGIRAVEQALGDGRKEGPVDGEMVEIRGRRLTWLT